MDGGSNLKRGAKYVWCWPCGEHFGIGLQEDEATIEQIAHYNSHVDGNPDFYRSLVPEKVVEIGTEPDDPAWGDLYFRASNGEHRFISVRGSV